MDPAIFLGFAIVAVIVLAAVMAVFHLLAAVLSILQGDPVRHLGFAFAYGIGSVLMIVAVFGIANWQDAAIREAAQQKRAALIETHCWHQQQAYRQAKDSADKTDGADDFLKNLPRLRAIKAELDATDALERCTTKALRHAAR